MNRHANDEGSIGRSIVGSDRPAKLTRAVCFHFVDLTNKYLAGS